MWRSLQEYLTVSGELIAAAGNDIPEAAMESAVDAIAGALRAGKPVLVCGNGGSAADAMHIAGELAVRFLEERRPWKAICLSSNPAVLTASANDYGYASVFARQVEAYGERGAVLVGLSTSGTSANVVAAFERAREMGMITVALTGEGGGLLGPLSDHLFAAPSRLTPLIQQVHTCLYHYLCYRVEQKLASGCL